MADSPEENSNSKLDEFHSAYLAYKNHPNRSTEQRMQDAYAEYHASNLQGDRIRKVVQEKLHQHWRILLGDQLESLLSSRSATESRLTDSDAKIRQGALAIIHSHWKPFAQSEPIYRQLAFSDPNTDVRSEALSCWCRLYDHSKNRKISTILASIITDPKIAVSLRCTAYIGLCNVQGIDPFQFFKSMTLEPDKLPEGIDWRWVNSFHSWRNPFFSTFHFLTDRIFFLFHRQNRPQM